MEPQPKVKYFPFTSHHGHSTTSSLFSTHSSLSYNKPSHILPLFRTPKQIMTSKRFIQLLLTVTAIIVIVIGLSVGVSKRIASSSLGTAATLATQATLEDGDCVQDDDSTAADGIVHRRRLDTVAMIVPSSSHRSVRGVESEWPWEEELRELAFSMEDSSMSVSSKAGKSSTGSIGKSGKSSTVRLVLLWVLVCWL